MPSPYSLDLRKRVVKAYQKGDKTFIELGKIYSIGEKTIRTWVKKYKIEGDLNFKTGYQKGHSHVIKDLEEFKEIINKNDFSTCQEIVNYLGKGSTSSIERALKKINYIKKNPKISRAR